MAFPATVLDLTSELYIDGAWVDVTSYVRSDAAVTITRARPNEAGRGEASRCTFSLNNRDGRFSNRNPNSPYFGQLGRNTPFRQCVDGIAGMRLVMTGEEGDYASTPDHASLDIVGDIDIRIHMRMPVFTGAETTGSTRADTTGTVLAAKYLSTGNQRSWALMLGDDLVPLLRWSATGSSTTITATATEPLPNHRDIALRATLDVNNGAAGNTATFYVSDSVGGTWTQLGEPVVTAGTTSIFSSSAVLEIGSANTGSVVQGGSAVSNGDVYAFQLRSSIGGTVVANPDFTIQASGATSFADNAGRTWTVNGDAAVTDRLIRFTGEVAAWPPRWDVTGTDVYVPVEAAGVLRRINHSSKTKPVRSALTRSLPRTSPLAWWPLESDLVSATDDTPDGVIALSVVSVDVPEPLRFSATNVVGSAALLDLSDGTGVDLRMPVHETPGTDGYVVAFNFQAPTGGFDAGGTVVLARLRFATQAGKSSPTTAVSTVDLSANTSGELVLTATGSTGTTSSTTDTARGSVYNDQTHHIRIETYQDGGGVSTYMIIDGASSAALVTLASTSLFTLERIQLNPTGDETTSVTPIGQVAVWLDTFSVDDQYVAALGYAGEAAARRMQRICLEEGIACTVIGDADGSVAMDVQQAATTDQLLQDIAEADQGILYEPREFLGLAYRCRSSMYDQASLALSYPANHLSAPFLPTDDDQLLLNDLTGRRPGGTTVHVEITDPNRLNTSDPPIGVGRYDRELPFRVATDTDLANAVGHRAHLGSWDEARYPRIVLDLHRQPYTDDAALRSAAALLDVGDALTIADPPAWLPPEDIEAIAQGMTERLWSYTWSIALNATPGGPWLGGYVGSTAGMPMVTTNTAKVGGSGMTTTATSFTSLNQIDPERPWTTDAADFPLDVMIGGERITVSAIADVAPTFVASGTIANGVNASVSPGIPAGLAAGDMMIMLAAIRNSGAGVPNAPLGWTRMAVFQPSDNVQVFYKEALGGGSDVAPTVTFTGGVAAADTQARIMGFRWVWGHLLHNASAQANASAQNVDFLPMSVREAACVVIAVAWKQDDFTSRAPLTGFTEAFDNPTATGNDQGIMADYQIQTTPTDIAALTCTVTGGAAAISKSAVFALRTLTGQNWTVSARSVNGIVKAHAQGDEIYPVPEAIATH
jgi:hypothetical protein